MSSHPFGRFENLADPDYRRIRAISKSGLDWFDLSPAHFRHVVIDGNAPKQTPAMATGSALDCLLLTPDLFERTFAVAPDVRRGTKAWDEFEAANLGKTLIKADDLAQLKRMRDAVHAHPRARELLSGGFPQVSYVWQDEMTGVAVKGRADYQRRDGVLIDVKTTGEGGGKTDAFMRSAYNFRYHVQAAMYSDGSALTGTAADAFLFIVIERDPPYPVAIFAADPELIAAGRAAYRKNLADYARCLEADTWPGYPEEVQALKLPAFALKERA